MNHHDPLLEQLNQLVSEGRNPDTLHIDTASTLDIVTAINTEDHKVAPAVAACLPDIARAVDFIADALQNGGRLIYTGAGTSGRLGILDAVECRPTFSVPDTLVVGVIAGGKTAIEHAVEGAEDDRGQGALDLADISLSAHDVVVGLSASGRTPYVTGALEYARQTGCNTIGGSLLTGYTGFAGCRCGHLPPRRTRSPDRFYPNEIGHSPKAGAQYAIHRHHD